MGELKDTLDVIGKYVPEDKHSIAKPIVIIALGIGLLVANLVADEWNKIY